MTYSEKPKRPISGYFRYLESIGEQVILENPEMPYADRTNLMGTMWAELTDDAWDTWNAEYRAALEPYKTRLRKWEDTTGLLRKKSIPAKEQRLYDYMSDTELPTKPKSKKAKKTNNFISDVEPKPASNKETKKINTEAKPISFNRQSSTTKNEPKPPAPKTQPKIPKTPHKNHQRRHQSPIQAHHKYPKALPNPYLQIHCNPRRLEGDFWCIKKRHQKHCLVEYFGCSRLRW